MITARETLYAAIFAKFAGITFSSGGKTTFGYTSRRLYHWDDLELADFPAMMQVQTREAVKQTRGLPPKWTLEMDLYIYVRTEAQSDDSVIPSQLLNPILDAIDAALKPDDLKSGVCTLGGLVSHAWIEGSVETSEGNLGDLEVAVVPLSILVPS
jgi:hypothetical protein